MSKRNLTMSEYNLYTIIRLTLKLCPNCFAISAEILCMVHLWNTKG